MIPKVNCAILHRLGANTTTKPEKGKGQQYMLLLTYDGYDENKLRHKTCWKSSQSDLWTMLINNKSIQVVTVPF
jgi:hypothetical protein